MHPGTLLSGTEYGAQHRPVVSAVWTVCDVPGAHGLYVEVDEMRITPFADADARDRLLTTNLQAVRSVMGGLPHYTQNYPDYGGEIGSIRIRR